MTKNLQSPDLNITICTSFDMGVSSVQGEKGENQTLHV